MTVVLDNSRPAAPGAAARNDLPRAQPVIVNGVTIDRAAISRETQNHPAAKPIEAWLAAARALVVRELLLQEARARGIGAVPLEDAEGRRETDEEALIRTLVEIDVITPTASMEECSRYYEQNRARFRSPAIFEVRHILFAAAPADHDAREKARRDAEAAIAMLAQEPQLFAHLAAERSACPSAKTGGNLGQISRGQTVPEFEAALERSAAPGLAPNPIETRYGFHVVCIDRQIDGAELPFEVVKERIAAWLEEKVRRTALRQYITGLAGRADITGISLDAEATPLVQ
ncbi:MAG: peptidylprolyl isomerase [Hyphomicrobium sp.]|nr:peptidylprolyl isomerase [Hyphomicrobium sp.]